MCVVSMIMDHWGPQFPVPAQPAGPQGGWTWPSNTVFTQFTLDSLTQAELAKLRQMLKDFYEAKAAAERVDELTSQKDCVDPDKALLLERVEALETALLALKKPTPKKRAKRAKKAKPKKHGRGTDWTQRDGL